MIKTGTERAQKSNALEKPRSGKVKKRWINLLWEGRWTISWTWLLVVIIAPCSFYIAYQQYQSALFHAQAMKSEGMGSPPPAMLDYGSALRNDLERFLPLICIVLVTGLLAQEWQRGTLLQLAMRKPLSWFLFVRLTYVLLYLSGLVFILALISWNISPDHIDGLAMWLWIWQTMLITLAPTLLLAAIGLLTAHLSVNLVTGYIVPATLWLANWLLSISIQQGHTQNDILSFLLFGWNDRMLTDTPDNWLAGKCTLCALALVLFLCQLPLLRQEARFLRSTE